MKSRASGLLLPISSLPGGWGIGSFGAQAHAFVDYLATGRQTYWQILPLGPTGVGDSPYQTFSSYAISPYYIDVDILSKEGLLTEEELKEYDCSSEDESVDYSSLYTKRLPLLRLAASRLRAEDHRSLTSFLASHPWASDYALFMSIKDHHGGIPWFQWPEDLRARDKHALQTFISQHENNFTFWAFTQQKAMQQWRSLREHAEASGIRFIGDLPFYVAHDSVDVWMNPQHYLLDEKGEVVRVAGYPPDAFSDDGQLWGNPIYNWKALQKERYAPWIERLAHTLSLFDYVRLDHFLGFENYWSIPAGEHPREGRWEKGPSFDVFVCSREVLGNLPLVAEDLGLVGPDVIRLRKYLGIPGMRILQFGFDPLCDNEHLPHNYERDSIVYTGTHDNETIVGWWRNLDKDAKRFARKYLRLKTGERVEKVAHAALMASSAGICILPVQDLLGIGEEGRINTPNTLTGNWTWRLREIPGIASAGALADMTITYRRTSLESV